MKGQFNIEYLFSLAVFIMVVIYLSVQISNVVPQHHQTNLENRLYAGAFRTSDILVKDPEIGLAYGPYNLSATKIINFRDSCRNNYEATRRNLTIGKRDFQIIVNVNSTLNFICGMNRTPKGASVINIKRYAITNEDPTEINVKVW